MTYPKVSIIILNWNGLKDTMECLESLKKITYLNYEIIIVDNGSKGNDVEVLENKYGDYIKLIKNKENLGFAEGNNVGIRQVLKEGRSNYILLLNNDTVVHPDFLTELVKVAENNKKIGVVGPKIFNYYQPDKIWAVGKQRLFYYFPIFFNKPKNKSENINFTGKVDYIIGCAMLIRKEVFKKGIFFDARFFLYEEEGDFLYRILKNDFEIYYTSKAVIWHKVAAASGGGLLNKISSYYRCRNKILFMRKNFTFLESILFIAYYLYFFVPPFVKNILKNNKSIYKNMFRGLSDGIRFKL